MVSEEGVLRLGDKEQRLPVIVGTENEVAVDISEIRANTGIVTFDRGFGNTAETKSAITFVNGEKGILRYRGYPIEQIAENASFPEVAYLLYHGRLPTRRELDDYAEAIAHYTSLRGEMKYLLEAFPKKAHPMQILASAISALATYYTDALDPRDEQAIDISTKRLLAKVPTMVAWSYRHSYDLPYANPRDDLDYTSNFLQMMFSSPTGDYEEDPLIARALDILFILHADHEQNCSATTVRVVGSGQANIFSSVAAGVHALSGPLHGGANQRVVEMLSHILEGGGNLDEFVARAKDKDDPFRLMGFGHRVYKNFDPRAQIIKDQTRQVLAKLGKNDPLLDLAMRLEHLVLEDDYFVERKLYPNVDFYSGILYRAMGFPVDMFPVLFAIGRLPGWIAQWREMEQDPTTRIGRPRQIYIGENERGWLPIEER